MNFTYCNATSETQSADDEVPLWRGYTFHHFGLILSALFGLIAVTMSCFLMYMHATHYLKPWEQKHIIRIVFMVPIYAIVSFLSYMFYRHAIYYQVLRDCYEAFAIASFFALLCAYIAPDLHAQKDYFRSIKVRPWLRPWWPVGTKEWIKTPRSGLTWFNIIWFCVFQYCFIRVFMTVVSVITQSIGRYCLDSMSPAFAHVWVTAIEAFCVTFAMSCLIQFYVQIKGDVTEHKPLLKILSIKLVIFLSFWQSLVLSALTSSSVIKESPQILMPDVKIGIPCLLLCIEMAIFSVLHLWAYPWREYDVNHSSTVAAESGAGYMPDPRTAYYGGRFGIKAFAEAFNPWDIIKAVARGFRWMVVGRKVREQDISYQTQRLGTPMQDSVIGKAGKYQPLEDDEGELPVPYDAHHTQEQAYASHGDFRTVQGIHQVQDQADHRTMAPGIGQADDGFYSTSFPREQIPGGPGIQDTEYHRAGGSVVDMPDAGQWRPSN